MKTEKNNDKSDKLRQRLTKLFKKGNVKVNQVNGNAQKDQLETKPIPSKMGNAHKDQFKTKPLPTKMHNTYKETLKTKPLPTKTGNAQKDQLKPKPLPTKKKDNGYKEALKPKPLPTTMEKPKSNIKAPTEAKPKNNSRKRKHQQNDANKKENKSSNLQNKQNKSAKTLGKGKLEKGQLNTKINGKGTKTAKYNLKAKVVNKKPKIDLPLVHRNGSNNVETSGSEDSEDYYDSDEDYSYEDDNGLYDQYDSHTDDSDAYSDSDENEHYFDDYEYDDSDSEYTESESEGYDYDSDIFSGPDPDYELPRNVAEDLVIHRGTAQKHDLGEEHNVDFDSDNDEPQVVELVVESQINEIKQPDAYAKTELHKLNLQFVPANKAQPPLTDDLNEKVENENDCPQLVPIVDEDGFQLYNSESDYSSYEELSDESSIPEEDINLKYTSSANVCDSDCDSENSIQIKKRKPNFNIGIVSVENCFPQESNQSVISSDEVEIERPIFDLLTAKKLQKFGDKGTLITVSICERTTTPEPAEETVEKNREELATQEVSEKELRNANVDLHTQTVNDDTKIVAAEETTSDNVDLATHYINEDSAAEEVELVNEEMDTSGNINDEIVKNFNINEIINNGQERSTFSSIFINAVSSNLVLALVKEPIYLYGTISLTLLAGKVEIYGYKPRLNEEVEIFSPRGCCSVDITSIPSDSSTKDKEIENSIDPLRSAFSSVDLERIEKAFESGSDALLLLKRNNRRKKLKNIFKKYMNENVFPNMNSILPDRPLYASEYSLDCVLNITTERSLRIPREWRELYFTKRSKVLLAGGKSVGKSTLLRYLLNRHLERRERVLVIDLDIGQAELFTPQTVSCTVLTQPLLGPGFFLNHQPTRAYAVGHSNIILCAQAYMRAVKQLIEYCHSNTEFAEMPWLINTMGYNKGFGLEVMDLITQLIRPTDVVQLQSNREINNFDILLHSHALARLDRTIYTQEEFKSEKSDSPKLEYRLHVLSSAVLQESRYQREWEMGAKDLRYATFLSRLSEVLQGSAEWLTDCVPFGVFIDKLHLVNLVSNKSTHEELLHALEANLVYLCRKEEENGEPLECFGIGIVRAIDLKKLYLLPAMSYDKLSTVNCLALGEMPLPASLFTNQGPKVSNMAAYLYNTVDAKTSKSIKQIYRRPTQFLTGKHKNLLND
ncbi:polynucleotide 5'-hydroxyl-kinase NOL9 [Bactrocera dorsalis]|uniref:Polynucleotide 5'-hydroxyl-kinase NOL9 n=1 Tax=Bactrocera dorsalis TaxID=27457 RepID=A0A6I9VT31_BACDO|nr:polynucleotide 5'-hydroxyl-kinase NOL9 [Bactrocera dorsalis]